jgi:hypothetical protein
MAVKNATTTISGTLLNKINGGTIMNAGNTSKLNISNYIKFKNLSQLINNLNPEKLQGLQVATNVHGLGFILTATGVAITSITQSSSTGYVNIAKTSHGLTVGTVIQVNGTSINNYNVIHRVTVVTDANNVQTDIRYTSNAGTPGTYSKMTTNSTFNKLTKNKYIGTLIGNTVAGLSSTILVLIGNAGVQSYNASNGTYGKAIATFDYFTGAKTVGATWGVLNKFHNISANNQLLVTEPHPSKAVPGRLVFKSYALIPTAKSYNPRTV